MDPGMMSSFMPHGMCFLWRPDLLGLHIISDALIACAYFSIPLGLAYIAAKRPDWPIAPLLWMFSLFIVSCGVTHIMSIVVIWHPLYWLEGGIKAITAVASLATAAVLVRLVPQFVQLMTPDEAKSLNARLHNAIVLSEHSKEQYEREHHIARTLQHASLPEIPEKIGRLELSAVYRPSTSDIEIGGDWYDAFSLADGRVVVTVGDAAGKGLDASVIMSKMRQAIRVSAQLQAVPGAILDAADRALKLDYPSQFVTAFVGIIDVPRNTIQYALAGHPPPLIRLADGRLLECEIGGLPLGLRERAESMENRSIDFPTGSLLVLYTDGLTESTHNYSEGERRLAEALRAHAVALGTHPAREITEAVLQDGIRDDVAILTVKNAHAPNTERRWSFFVGDAAAAATVRGAIMQILRQHNAFDDEIFAAEMIFSELIGNVARHAGGEADIRLDWTDEMPILHVLDHGPGFAYVPDSLSHLQAESGRGLFIAEQMAQMLTVNHRYGGGSHARAELHFSGHCPRIEMGFALA